MSKMSELAAELQELRRCGETLIGISDTLCRMFSEADERQEKPEKAAAKPKGKAAKEAEPKEQAGASPKEPEKKLTLADVRAVLAEKSRAGYTQEVKAIIEKHGADKLSDVDESEYAALLADAEVLG